MLTKEDWEVSKYRAGRNEVCAGEYDFKFCRGTIYIFKGKGYRSNRDCTFWPVGCVTRIEEYPKELIVGIVEKSGKLDWWFNQYCTTVDQEFISTVRDGGSGQRVLW